MPRSLASTTFPAYAVKMTLPFHTPLTSAQQIDAGLGAAQSLAMADQVRFSELDVLNHVNNARYMEWFERLRIRYVQEWGISQYDRPEDPRIVIRSGTIHYRREMRMDEVYITTCACATYRSTSFSLRQQLWAGGDLRATFDCVLVLRSPDGAAGYPIPAPVLDRFHQIDQAKKEG